MKVGLTRRNIGRLILLGWAVALAWLARRQFAESELADTARRTRQLAPGAQYYAVYAAPPDRTAQPVGDTLVDGVKLTEVLALHHGGRPTRLLARGPSTTSPVAPDPELHPHHVGAGERSASKASWAPIRSESTNVGGAQGTPGRMRCGPPRRGAAVMLPYAPRSATSSVGGRFVAPLLDLGVPGTRPSSSR